MNHDRRRKTLDLSRFHQYLDSDDPRSGPGELASSVSVGSRNEHYDTSDNQIRRIVVEGCDRCTVCHRRFGRRCGSLSRKSDVWLMIVQCKDCHSRSFAASSGNRRPRSNGVTDRIPIDGSIEITFEMDADMFDTDMAGAERDRVSASGRYRRSSRYARIPESFDGDFDSLFRDLPKG